jgi:ATPase subunit of ABC transporter with duplicated ATPase domains
LRKSAIHDAVCSALDAETAETEGWRVEILLDDLAVDEALRRRTVSGLSGGWQRIMLLAHAVVVAPDLLLLDEPTNHLDISRIGVLDVSRIIVSRLRGCCREP